MDVPLLSPPGGEERDPSSHGQGLRMTFNMDVPCLPPREVKSEILYPPEQGTGATLRMTFHMDVPLCGIPREMKSEILRPTGRDSE